MSIRSWFAVATIATAVLVSGCGSSTTTTSSPKTSPGSSVAASTTAKTSTAPAAPLLNRRAGNGEVVQENGLVGSGILTIVNDNSADYAIVVTNGDPKNPQATIYVQGNSQATLNGIAGTYYVYLKSGVDWDQATLNFTRDRDFSKFDDPFDADSDWEIELKPSIGGNASTSDVPAF
ncbi:hypothetical protein [Nocardia sp. NPDC127526]|uniref:hypothetical protein n=1 Tax=Nocardia sp. NPDC127526 TaxID=3345393 RepID=UPI0036330276